VGTADAGSGVDMNDQWCWVPAQFCGQVPRIGPGMLRIQRLGDRHPVWRYRVTVRPQGARYATAVVVALALTLEAAKEAAAVYDRLRALA